MILLKTNEMAKQNRKYKISIIEKMEPEQHQVGQSNENDGEEPNRHFQFQ